VLVASKYFGRSVDELDSVKDSRSHGLVRDDGDLSNMMHLTAVSTTLNDWRCV